MKNKLQHALYELDAMERTAQMQSPLHHVDARAKLVVVAVLLTAMLSLPLRNLSDILLFCVVPIVAAPWGCVRYGAIFRRSLYVLPFVAFVGIFNPIYDRQAAFWIGDVAISEGWVSFFSILLRGVLSVQVLLILIYTTGVYNLCRGLQRLGLPVLFTTQLLFVYRYLFVLLREALGMSRARDARSFGRRSYPLRLWAMLIGQLLIRTFARAERIDLAMRARGFDGHLPAVFAVPSPWRMRESCFVLCCGAIFVAMRLFHPIERISLLFV